MARRYLRAIQTNAEMRASAQETLAQHNIVVPPVNIFQILHDEDIPVDFIRFNSKKIEGIYLNNITGASIAINAVHHSVKQRFTGAHELKHHRHDTDLGVLHCKSAYSRRTVEVRANRYAAELLMPVDMVQTIIRELHAADLLTVTTLSRAFRVSYPTAIYRLNSLGYIADGAVEQLLKSSARKDDTKAAMGHNGSKNVAQLKSHCLIATLGSPSGLSYCPHCSELIHNTKWTICYSCGDDLNAV